MNVGSDFEPIYVKMNNPPKSLEMKIFTYKGLVNLMPYEQLDRIENYEYLKQKVRSLPPNEYFTYNLYWELYYTVKPVTLRSKSCIDKAGSYLVRNMIRPDSSKHYLENIIDDNSMSFELNPYVAWEFFTKFIDKSKPLKTTFLFGALGYSSIEEYIRFRKSFTINSIKDHTTAFELNYLEADPKRRTPVDIITDFKNIYPFVNYNCIDKNICSPESRQNFINQIDDNQDCIFSDIMMTYGKSELTQYISYLNCQTVFSIIILLVQKLKKGGLAYFSTAKLDTQLMFDIIAILSYLFEEVYIFKSSRETLMLSYKKIVCKGFKKEKSILESLTKIANQWYLLSNSCNVGLNNTLDLDTYYVDRIIGYKDQIYQIMFFNNLEAIKRGNIWNKMINAYYDIEKYGQDIIDRLNQARLSNSLFYMKKYKILSNIPNIELNNNILINALSINLYDIKTNCRLIDSPHITNKDIELIDNFTRFEYNKSLIIPYHKKEYNVIWDKINPYSDLINSIKLKTNKKVDHTVIYAYEILKTFKTISNDKKVIKDLYHINRSKEEIINLLENTNKKNSIYKMTLEYNPLLFDIVTKACQRYNEVYIYYSTVYQYIDINIIYLVCCDLKPKIKDIVHIDMNNCFKIIIDRMIHWYQIINYFYQNPSALDNIEQLKQIKKLNSENWILFYDL